MREEISGTSLPERCPERHIQYDQTFCLGLSYIDVNSAEAAAQWWEQLRQYLVRQAIAERTGIWSPGHALDQSDAGENYLKAMNLAAELDLRKKYASARLGDPSWITDPRLQLIDREGKPINGRALCPRGCLRRARGRNVPALRVDCPNRERILELVATERKRRTALEQYWQDMFKDGTRC